MNTGWAHVMFRAVFIIFISISIVIVAIRIEKRAVVQSFTICHGEFEAICKKQVFRIDRFEHCGDDNGVSGAKPRATAILLCGSEERGARAEIKREAPSTPGNQCGNTGFSITCPK